MRESYVGNRMLEALVAIVESTNARIAIEIPGGRPFAPAAVERRGLEAPLELKDEPSRRNYRHQRIGHAADQAIAPNRIRHVPFIPAVQYVSHFNEQRGAAYQGTRAARVLSSSGQFRRHQFAELLK